MRRRSLVVGATVLLLFAASACGDPTLVLREADSSGDRVPASGFVVEWVPDGFGSGRAAVGTGMAELSSDSFGSVEPFVVLAPADDASVDPSAVILVGLSDGSGNEGGLQQNLLPADGATTLTAVVRGRETWTYELASGGHEVVARVDGERGVRVQSREAPVELLQSIAIGTELSERTVRRVSVPAGWREVSRVDAEQVANLGVPTGALGAGSDVPAARGAFVRTWDRGTERLKVALIDGTSSDLAAAGLVSMTPDEGRSPEPMSEREGDRWWSERRTPTGEVRRELVQLAPSGSLLFVGTGRTDDGELLTRAELERVADSVRVDPAAWDAELRSRDAAPPRPDPGRTVVASGNVGGVDWVLQDLGNDAPSEGDLAVPGLARVDPSLLLRGGRRLTSSDSGWFGRVASTRLTHASRGEPPFTALVILTDDATASISLEPGAPPVPTSPAPGGRIAVVIPAPSLAAGIPIHPQRFDAAGNLLPD